MSERLWTTLDDRLLNQRLPTAELGTGESTRAETDGDPAVPNRPYVWPVRSPLIPLIGPRIAVLCRWEPRTGRSDQKKTRGAAL